MLSAGRRRKSPRKEVRQVREKKEQAVKSRYEKPELLDLGAVVMLTGS